MKRILKNPVMALLFALGSFLTNTASAQYDGDYNDGYGDRDVSYQTFYDELSPHGRWVDYPGHGYVWVPDAGPDFRPYSSNGHWVYSEDYEWMWVSDYDWGWAPFHYGRWDHDASYGWYWVPGYEWSPAWVAWRDGGDYYGWAPIRPGINISINFNIGGYAPPVDFWCFTPRRYITYPRIYDYCVPYRQNVTIINHTTIITNNFRYGNNYGFRSGPRRYDAERYTGRINPVRFRQSNGPGRTTFRNNEVSIYRPNIRRDNNNRTFAPRSFERYDRNNANNNNGFRRNNEVVRNNGNNNNRFERRDNTPGNNDRIERRNTNTPGSNTDRRFERRDDVRQPQTNPGNTNGQPNRRFERRDDNPGNTNNPNREPRVRTNENPQRQPVERRVEPRQQQQPRQFERRQEPRTQPQQQQQQPRQFERRQEPRTQPQQQQQRTFERRSEPRPQQQQQPRQIERRQESKPQQQQPSRQFERRDNGNSNSGNGNGRGRGRN
jgi:hypothetical protein